MKKKKRSSKKQIRTLTVLGWEIKGGLEDKRTAQWCLQSGSETTNARSLLQKERDGKYGQKERDGKYGSLPRSH